MDVLPKAEYNVSTVPLIIHTVPQTGRVYRSIKVLFTSY